MEEKMRKQKKGKQEAENEKNVEAKDATTVDPNYVTKLEDAE